MSFLDHPTGARRESPGIHRILNLCIKKPWHCRSEDLFDNSISLVALGSDNSRLVLREEWDWKTTPMGRPNADVVTAAFPSNSGAHNSSLLHCQAGLACFLSHPACCITNIAVNQLPIIDFVAQASEMAALCRRMAPLVLSFPFPRTMSSYRLGFTCCTTASVTFGDISKFDRFIPTWTLRRWLFSEQGNAPSRAWMSQPLT
ncbi:uncharacterized protein CLUP02_13376 [Colletotrichum lupini]|uniref:Uncharacterized protein n=1 Tax=Colletotrichum lupini TaxID=145971 RepID=A0A9Q8T2J8_9PEZI|nr:uncharacterized protein CLUP02_13376 [Colletotrichum lupini]UQC87855.1 hypothetical protein CLUP02_13376 [Colletotrichum lupini]